MRYSLGLVLLYTRDMAKAKAFYVDALGLETVPQLSSDDFLFLNLAGGSPIALQTVATMPPGVEAQPGGCEISLQVEDVDAAHAEWKERGLDVTSEVYDMGAGRMFAASDPDGHRVSVHQLYAGIREMREGTGDQPAPAHE
jgi:predicted enzyme related to lactoylglutathione lyase